MREYTVKEYNLDDYVAVKDGISKEELCDILECIKSGFVPDYNFTGTEEDFENYKLHMAIYKAIDYISGRNKVVFPD